MAFEPMRIVWAGDDGERGEERGDVCAKDVEGGPANEGERASEGNVSSRGELD